MQLTPEGMVRLQALFEQALALVPEQRSAFLESLGETREMRDEVLALLAAHESGATLPHSGLDPQAAAPEAGRRIGAWRVERLLGQGGMGTVCEAVRADAQFEKRVAIKFLHAHARHSAAEQRFRAERQMLANLDHPNIATLLDGGVTDDGQPYIVMEYIDGEPITAWADARALSRDARVDLFLQVCAAVEAAHRNLIVHRDLKPGNILVNKAGRVKLLDFGIARLLDEVAPEPVGTPASELRSFTPTYAAPEQLRAAPVTTATDVFALGVVLFRLLTGRLPFESRVDPDEVAESAGLAPDLDAIIAKALHVQSEGRYSTVQELRADLERWLKDEPVAAFSGGPRYRARKFLRRHRIGSALAAAAIALILTATAVALGQYHAARRAAADQKQLNAFLMDVLNMSDPFGEGDELTLSTALDRAADRINERFAGRPDLSAELRFGIAYSMMNRYRLEQAEVQFALALTESIAQFGKDDVRTLRVEDGIAGLRLEQARLNEAAATYQKVISALESQHETADPLYPTALGNLGNVYLQQERYQDAYRELRHALDAASTRAIPVDADTHAGLLSNLAHATHGLKDYARAERYYADAETEYRALFPDGSPDLAILYNNHASLYEDRGDFPQALQMYQQSLAMRRKVFHNEHPMVVTALLNVARMLLATGDPAAALRFAEEGAALADRVYTEPNRFHPSIHAALADARLANGNIAGARASMLRAQALLSGQDDPPPSTVQRVKEVRARICEQDPGFCRQ